MYSIFHKNRQQGFSLIELMISMAIGLFLVVGVFTVYVNGRSSQKVVDDQVALINNARFVLETMSYDIRVAGVYGRVTEAHKVDTTLLPAVGGECVAGWVDNVNAPIMAFNDGNPYGGSCATAYGTGDILELRYTLKNPVAALATNKVYINSDVNKAVYFTGNASPAVSATAKDYEAVTKAYYVSNYTNVAGDNLPSLHRVALEPGPTVVDDVLLSGVEDLQIQIGLDSDDDNSIEKYVDPSAAIDWGAAKTVEIWLVVRSEDKYPDMNTSTSAIIAGVNRNFPNDGYRRMVVSSVAKLRNLQR